jgi:hypothetical protein
LPEPFEPRTNNRIGGGCKTIIIVVTNFTQYKMRNPGVPWEACQQEDTAWDHRGTVVCTRDSKRSTLSQDI